MNTDPRETLASAPMSVLQMIAVAITVGLTALDGFDVLSISFALPGIADEWHADRGALGIVLSMELIGMSIGSIFLGSVADRFGRRPTMLLCLGLMTGGMFMVTTAREIGALMIWRVMTGLGIGGLLAAANAVAAEFSNLRRRNLNVSLMAIGYPIGAALGGLIVAGLLRGHNWRAVFYFGAAVTALFIPLVYLLIPESVQWLARRQPRAALPRINVALARMRQTAITALPALSASERRRPVGDIFAPHLLPATVLLTLTYFFHITTFYFILKWAPKIVADMHFPASSAAAVLVWANVGGALGGTTLGIISQRVRVKALTVIMMAMSAVMVSVFGRSAPNLQQLSLLCACAGFFTNGAAVGLYAIFPQAFPTHVRATGTGFVIGVGRAGSIVAPILAGYLFKWGYGLPTVALYMSLGSLAAAASLSQLRLKPDQMSSTTLLSSASS